MCHLLMAIQTDGGLLAIVVYTFMVAFIAWVGGEQNQRNKG